MLTALGRFAPFLIIGAVISAVGAGLLYTLDIGSSTGTWIGFQVLAGVGIGPCFQVPIMVGQALAAPEDIATVTAILMCKSHSIPPTYLPLPPFSRTQTSLSISPILPSLKTFQANPRGTNSHPNNLQRPLRIRRSIRLRQHSRPTTHHQQPQYLSRSGPRRRSNRFERCVHARSVAGNFGVVYGCVESCFCHFNCNGRCGGCGGFGCAVD